MKKECKIFIGIFVILLLVSLVVSQESQQTTNDYDSKKPQTWFSSKENFVELEKDLTDNSKVEDINNAISSATPSQREYIFDRIKENIYDYKTSQPGILEKYVVGKITEIINNIALKRFPDINKQSPEEKEKKLSEVRGLISKKYNLWESGKDVVRLEQLVGFGNSRLKFSTSEHTGSVIVGDGKVYLDLARVPNGVDKVKYDGNNFVLYFKTGGSIVLGPGSTDEKGNLKLFSKLSEKSPMRMAMIPIINPENPLGTEFLTLLGDNKGEIIIGENSIEIKGDGMGVRYGEFVFKRKIGEDAEKSTIRFASDRIVILGIEFLREGYVSVGSSKEDFIYWYNDVRLHRALNFEELETPSQVFIRKSRK